MHKVRACAALGGHRIAGASCSAGLPFVAVEVLDEDRTGSKGSPLAFDPAHPWFPGLPEYAVAPGAQHRGDYTLVRAELTGE